MLPTPHPPADGGRATSLIVWLVVCAVLFGAFVVLAGPAAERRSRFWLRVVVLPVIPAAFIAILIALAHLAVLPEAVAMTLLLAVLVLIFPALILVPAVLYRRPGSSPDDDGGGGGRGPRRPPVSPGPPGGGVPLPDADQARARRRDHSGSPLGRRRPRRPAVEPARPRRVRTGA